MSSLLLIASLLAPPPAAPVPVAPPSAGSVSTAPASVAPASKAAKKAPTQAEYAAKVHACLRQDAELGRIEDAGEHAFVWHFKKPVGRFDRAVVLKDLGEGCESVFRVGRADARVIAPFDPKNGGMKAFIVQNQRLEECEGDDAGGCERVLILRDKSRKYLSVLPLGQCEHVVALTAVEVLPGQPSIMVECGFSGGGDMLGHSHELVHVIDGQLTSLVSASTGHSMEDFNAEPAKCRIGPNGFIRVLQKGAKARIEVYEPDSKIAQTLEWDGKAFKKTARRSLETEPGAGPSRCDFKWNYNSDSN